MEPAMDWCAWVLNVRFNYIEPGHVHQSCRVPRPRYGTAKEWVRSMSLRDCDRFPFQNHTSPRILPPYLSQEHNSIPVSSGAWDVTCCSVKSLARSANAASLGHFARCPRSGQSMLCMRMDKGKERSGSDSRCVFSTATVSPSFTLVMGIRCR